jgi:hypothetical protein
MTSIPQEKKLTVRHGHLMFSITCQHQGSKYYRVASESPTFLKTLGVKEYVFFTARIPDMFVGPEGNTIANDEQLSLLDSIMKAIANLSDYSF